MKEQTKQIFNQLSKIVDTIKVQPVTRFKLDDNFQVEFNVKNIEDLPEFSVYSMSEFLQVIDVIQDPVIDINGTKLNIKSKDGRIQIQYLLSDDKVFDEENKFTFQETGESLGEVSISKQNLINIKKSAQVFQLNNFRIKGDNEFSISVSSQTESDNDFNIAVQGTKKEPFNKIVIVGLINYLPETDYTVSVFQDHLEFKSADSLLRFIIKTKN